MAIKYNINTTEQKATLNQVWEYEEYDFTPWLAKNLEGLAAKVAEVVLNMKKAVECF